MLEDSGSRIEQNGRSKKLKAASNEAQAAFDADKELTVTPSHSHHIVSSNDLFIHRF